MGGVLGATSAVGARMVMRQPLYARVHAFALQVTAGYWIGYQWNKWCSKKNMSEYKHAVDFAQRHSVCIFSMGCMSHEADCYLKFRISFTNKNQLNSDHLKFLNIGHWPKPDLDNLLLSDISTIEADS